MDGLAVDAAEVQNDALVVLARVVRVGRRVGIPEDGDLAVVVDEDVVVVSGTRYVILACAVA